MQAKLYKYLKVIWYFSLKTLSMENLLYFYSLLFHDKDKVSIILLENIPGCQQTFRSSDSQLSPDFWCHQLSPDTRPKSLLTAGCHQTLPSFFC